ncbi:hypothetical protein QBL02_04485 [Leucobacter sp. UT-8R-CII-1-4]|uniref:hypothetical protein n=1 Tax=Leucobacter sp. UT-8R-CII-1-4 TaxID=3040075 RepID=UPI0024A81C7A|nr:hypothetical protein [Leucobacter sp. UT-8R-CII-1-4]MDI6022796.1 hypothetical protein [Leucobacter sp. UT-8R-CII-1-4]
MNSSPKLDPILVAILDSGRHTKHRVHSPHVRPSLDRNGELVRLHRGSYMPKRRWSALSTEDRHLAAMLSAQRAATRPLVFSRLSAAILLGLSVHKPRDTRVHIVTSESGAGKTTAGIVRHRCPIDSAEIVSVHGLLCTSPFRTLLDLARFEPAELALAAADSYLRQEYRVGRIVDSNEVEQWREAFAIRLRLLRGHRGVRRALQVCELADARCDSVLESVSHLQLRRLGFDVALQVAVPARYGGHYFVDFELLGLGVFAECDGKSKYTNSVLRGGLSAEEVVYREKRREEWISSSTGKRIVRWGYADVATPITLAQLLESYGVPIPKSPSGRANSSRLDFE